MESNPARGVQLVSDSPIVLERVLRFVAACLGLLTTLALSARLRSEVKTSRARLFGTAFLLLYWPFLYTHARLSAEPWGSNAFYAALLLLPRAADRQAGAGDSTASGRPPREPAGWLSRAYAVFTHPRSTSATLQAWATQPLGAQGSSASKTSLI